MPRWEPNAKLRLVDAALELFEEQGYEATTVAEIAARAGLTKTTFFRHFPDKREVMSAGQEAHSQLLADAIAQAPASVGALELVAGAVEALAASFPPQRRDFGRRLHRVIAAHSELRERTAAKTAGYTAAVGEALAQRGIPATAAAVAAELGMLAFNLAYAEWTETDTPAPLTELTRAKLAEIAGVSGALAAAVL